MSRRGVWQLQRIAFNYCEHSGSSRGAREFIKHSSNSSSGYLTSFMEDNPQIDVTMTVRPGRHPWIEATYLNGRVRSVSMRNDDPVEILRQMMNLRSSVGRKTTCGRKSNRQTKERVVTQQPSIQGRWTPALATALANGKVLIRLLTVTMKMLLMAILAVTAATAVSADTSMNGYFMADLKNADGEMTGSMNASLQEGVWNWIMTSTFPVESVEIVDRKGSALEPEFRNIVDIPFGSSENGTYEGTFDNADVDTSNTPYLFKEERNMTNAHQLAGHMCMGHIFAVVNGTDGASSYGALMYMGDGEDDCYVGTGTESMRMKMDMDGDAGMDMGEEDDSGMDMGEEDTGMDMGEEDDSGMAAGTSSATSIAFSAIGMMMMMMMFM